jgi:hypothetical protein
MSLGIASLIVVAFLVGAIVGYLDSARVLFRELEKREGELVRDEIGLSFRVAFLKYCLIVRDLGVR